MESPLKQVKFKASKLFALCWFMTLGYMTIFCSAPLFLTSANRTLHDFGHSLLPSMSLSLSASSKTSLLVLRDSNCWECKKLFSSRSSLLYFFTDTLQHTLVSSFFLSLFYKGLRRDIFFICPEMIFFLLSQLFLETLLALCSGVWLAYSECYCESFHSHSHTLVYHNSSVSSHVHCS